MSRLEATEENVREVRRNVLMGVRTRADLRRCGCPACEAALENLEVL